MNTTLHDNRSFLTVAIKNGDMPRSTPELRLGEAQPDGLDSSIGFDDGLIVDSDEESETPRYKQGKQRASARLVGRRTDDNNDGGTTSVKTNKQSPAGSRLLFATSAALTRVKGMTLRSGTSGRVLNPRSVTLVSGLLSPSRGKKGVDNDGAGRTSEEDRSRKDRPFSQGNVENDKGTPWVEDPGEDDDVGGAKSNKQKLSVLFDDDESDAENGTEEGASPPSTSTNDSNAATPRSKWAATLMASTLAREKATGKAMVRNRVDLLPHPREAANKVWWHSEPSRGDISFTRLHVVSVYAYHVDLCLAWTAQVLTDHFGISKSTNVHKMHRLYMVYHSKNNQIVHCIPLRKDKGLTSSSKRCTLLCIPPWRNVLLYST